MKKITKTIILTTALTTAISTITPTLNPEASTATTTLNKEITQNNFTLSQSEIIKFNEYIDLNNNNSYTLKDEALKELTESEYKKINSILSEVNQAIIEMNNDPTIVQDFEIEVLPPQNHLNNPINTVNNNQLSTRATKASKYKEGVSKVTVHWWGLKFYLSRSLANKALVAGTTLGGIWLPSRTIASVGAMLGVTGAKVFPGGIWIEHHWVAPAGFIKSLFGFNAAGYQ